MYIKSKGIIIPKSTYTLYVQSNPRLDRTVSPQRHIIQTDLEHEDIMNVLFFTHLVQSIQEIYEQVEG